VLLVQFLPIPYGFLVIFVYVSVFAVWTCASSKESRVALLPKVYCVLLIVAAGLMAFILWLREMNPEAGGMFSLFFVIELAFSLPIILYVAVMSVIHD